MSAQAYDLVIKTIPILFGISAIIGSWYVSKYQIKRADEDIRKLGDKIDKEVAMIQRKASSDMKSITDKLDAILIEYRTERDKFATKEMVLLVERNVQLKISEKANTIHDQLQYLIVEMRELRNDYKEILRGRKGS